MSFSTRQHFSLLCIGLCGTFWLLTLIGTIPWSFRWYGIAALVSLCALREVWLLIRPCDTPPPASRARIVLRTGAVVLPAFIAVTPALIFPPYARPEPTGAYGVATVLATFTDENRIEAYGSADAYRRVNVEFWYPQQEQCYALPGARQSRLRRRLDWPHPYHAFWTQDVQGRLTFLSWDYFGELMREDARRDKQQSHTYYQRWMDTRMGDINFVIGTVLTSATAGVEGVYRLVDPDKIGVMGHSLGGSAALGIGRQRSDIGAVMVLEAPFMTDIVGVDGDEFVFVDDAQGF